MIPNLQLDMGVIMNMYRDEIIKTLEHEVVELKDKVNYFRERSDYNQIQMRKYQSQLAEAVSVLKQLKEVKY